MGDISIKKLQMTETLISGSIFKRIENNKSVRREMQSFGFYLPTLVFKDLSLLKH